MIGNECFISNLSYKVWKNKVKRKSKEDLARLCSVYRIVASSNVRY